MHPYIGVTGFVSASEVKLALDCMERTGVFKTPTLLMVGVLASAKTINGGKNRYAHRYPGVDRIAEIFPPHRRTLNLIHYATDERETLREQIKKLVALGGPYLDGFQFNIAWPAPEAILVPGMRVVLQIGGRALEECGHDPEKVWRKLTYYDPEITDVLIDASGGKGIAMDTPTAAAYMKAIHEQIPRLGVGVAGGLSGETMDLVRPLFGAKLKPSIDAEGQLRDSDDILNLKKMTEYLEAAARLYL